MTCLLNIWKISLFFGGFFFLHFRNWNINMMGTKPHRQNLNNMRHIPANPQFIRHFIYLLFMFVHLDRQSSEDTSRKNVTFSTILIFLYYKNFWHKIESELMLGSVGGVFMWDFLTGGVQVNESIKEQVHLKISKRKHFPHKQISKNQRSAMYKLCFRPWRCSAEVCVG